MKKMTAVVLGYGNRGAIYSDYALSHPQQLQIVAVAEALENRRETARRHHGLQKAQLFESWEDLAELPRMADIAIITTQDRMHLGPALAMIEKGYHLLLEKPMAPTAWECRQICQAAQRKGVEVIVCHVLRFTPFWKRIKALVEAGDLGSIMSIVHMENVGNLHQSHSFVRGNWRSSQDSAPMILAKCCHDMDILQWLIGKKCVQVQSFGALSYFKPENRPAGAPERCTQGCPAADTCYYNAVRFYIDNKQNHWRPTVANTVDAPSDAQVLQALQTGPYGRCVYSCDNDVVDHQVVNLLFEDGCTVAFSMNAFNQGGRAVRIFGTAGELVGDMEKNTLRLYRFRTGTWEDIPVEGDTGGDHSGGDSGIMEDTLQFLAGSQRANTICGVQTSYENHLIAFAAEQSRLQNRVVDLAQFDGEMQR